MRRTGSNSAICSKSYALINQIHRPYENSLTLLKSAAANKIQPVPFCSESFDQAGKILCEENDNTRLLTEVYVNQLCYLPKVRPNHAANVHNGSQIVRHTQLLNRQCQSGKRTFLQITQHFNRKRQHNFFITFKGSISVQVVYPKCCNLYVLDTLAQALPSVSGAPSISNIFSDFDVADDYHETMHIEVAARSGRDSLHHAQWRKTRTMYRTSCQRNLSEFQLRNISKFNRISNSSRHYSRH